MADKKARILPAEDKKAARAYGLTDKEYIFCNEYLATFNQTKSALAASCSKSNAPQWSRITLKKPHVIKYVQDNLRSRIEDLKLRGVAVLDELAIIAFSDIADYIDVEDGYPRIKDITEMRNTAAVQSIKLSRFGDTVELKLYDKMAALEKLGRFAGALKESEQPLGGDGPAYDEVDHKVRLIVNHREKGQKLVKQIKK